MFLLKAPSIFPRAIPGSLGCVVEEWTHALFVHPFAFSQFRFPLQRSCHGRAAAETLFIGILGKVTAKRSYVTAIAAP